MEIQGSRKPESSVGDLAHIQIPRAFLFCATQEMS